MRIATIQYVRAKCYAFLCAVSWPLIHFYGRCHISDKKVQWTWQLLSWPFLGTIEQEEPEYLIVLHEIVLWWIGILRIHLLRLRRGSTCAREAWRRNTYVAFFIYLFFLFRYTHVDILIYACICTCRTRRYKYTYVQIMIVVFWGCIGVITCLSINTYVMWTQIKYDSVNMKVFKCKYTHTHKTVGTSGNKGWTRNNTNKNTHFWAHK